MRYGRTDDNQREIVTTAQSMGCTVFSLASMGDGCPDLIIGCSGANLLVEVKDGNKPPSAQKLTKDQIKFHDMWRGKIYVITSSQSMIDLVNQTRKAR